MLSSNPSSNCRVAWIAALACLSLALAACREPHRSTGAAPAQSRLTPGREVSAGRSPNAYGHALANLPREHWADVRAGKALFTTTWVPAAQLAAERAAQGPSALVRAGLGPRFNATSCQGCHFKDGRGRPPPDVRELAAGRADAGTPSGPPRLLRLSVLAHGEVAPEPSYGGQLQDQAVVGLRPEGQLEVGVRRITSSYADGTPFVLEAPVVRATALAQGPLHPEVRQSLRSPPSLIGLGLLEAVPESALLALADPQDANGDGISGRVHHVRDPDTGAQVLGRFGWKASQPSLRLQNATALREDLGITTTVFPSPPCLAADALCLAAAGDASPELDEAGLEQLTRYTRLLMPPAPRPAAAGDPQDAALLARGVEVFTELGCAACHQPHLRTGVGSDLPELDGQDLAPYSDLLLHDLGEGLADELGEATADERPDGEASGREWRTAPLWGLGLLGVVSGQVHLLHDGRARSVEEAILWHGGEAQRARDAFVLAPRNERSALLRFLDSL